MGERSVAANIVAHFFHVNPFACHLLPAKLLALMTTATVIKISLNLFAKRTLAVVTSQAGASL